MLSCHTLTCKSENFQTSIPHVCSALMALETQRLALGRIKTVTQLLGKHSDTILNYINISTRSKDLS